MSLPHHCILRKDSSSTKLRVVFNASLKANKGYSLNKNDNNRHCLQLFDILCKFFMFKFATIYAIGKTFPKIFTNLKLIFLQHILGEIVLMKT